MFFGTYEIMAKIKYDKFPSSQKKAHTWCPLLVLQAKGANLNSQDRTPEWQIRITI